MIAGAETSAVFVTPRPWHLPGKLRYGAADTYRLAADWLQTCPTVADWGGGTGFFRPFLPNSVRYTRVDGTQQPDRMARALTGNDVQVLADLTTYREPSDGILLRHVLDNTDEWQPILANALTAFRQRLVVVTYTPAATMTTVVRHEHGWPVRHFDHEDLIGAMGSLLVRFAFVPTSHPERVYYLERR